MEKMCLFYELAIVLKPHNFFSGSLQILYSNVLSIQKLY